MRNRVFFNSLSGGIQFIISATLLLYSIPLLIDKLGDKLYGVYSMVLLIGNLNSLTNFGLNTALVKYISEQGKCKESDHDIVYSILFLLCFLIPLFFILIYFSNEVLEIILNIPSELINSDTILFYNFVVVANLLIIIGQMFIAVLDAQQKIYITNFLFSFYNLLYWGSIIVMLYIFSSLGSIGIAILSSTVIWFVLMFYFVSVHWGRLELADLKKDFYKKISKQLHYGSKIYISSLISFFHEPFSKILVSHFLGITSVVPLEIALRVKGQMWTLIAKVLYPIFPLIANTKDNKQNQIIVKQSFKMIFIIIVPTITAIIFSTGDLLNLWLGERIDFLAITTIVLLTFNLLAAIGIPIYHYLMAKDSVNKIIVMQFLNASVSVFIFLFLYRLMYFYSVIISQALAILSSTSIAFTISINYLV